MGTCAGILRRVGPQLGVGAVRGSRTRFAKKRLSADARIFWNRGIACRNRWQSEPGAETYRARAHHRNCKLSALTLRRMFSSLGSVLDVRQRDGQLPRNGEKVFRRRRYGSVGHVRFQQGHQSDYHLGRFQRLRYVQAFRNICKQLAPKALSVHCNETSM